MTYLIDTNVLVYAFDKGDPVRSSRARAWLDLLIDRGEGALSVQALREFANVVMRRMTPAWSASAAAGTVRDLARAFGVVPVTPAIVVEALRGVEAHGMSFYDAQMWAAAQLNQIPYLLTEDMATGATFDGVTIVDAFATEPPAQTS